MALACPQCHQQCKSLSGLRRHENAIHRAHPGLSVPVAELHRTYHPNLSGMYSTIATLLHTDPSQACAVISKAVLSPPTFRQNPQPPTQMMIGPLFHPEPGLNLQSSRLPTPSFLGERSISSSSCGLPHSFLMAALRPSPTPKISIAKSMRSRLGTSCGRRPI